MSSTTTRILVVCALVVFILLIVCGGSSNDDETTKAGFINDTIPNYPSKTDEDTASSVLTALELSDDSLANGEDSTFETKEENNEIKEDDNHYEIPTYPTSIKGKLLKRKGYTLYYNYSTLCPSWVAWDMTPAKVNGKWGRSDDYRADEDIPNKLQVDENTYKGLGYDRGHMCPAGDMSWDSKAMSESFLMTNMCPQENNINNGGWRKVEEACRRWAERGDKIYICCGPIYTGGEKKIGYGQKVTVPSAFFKVVLTLKPGKEMAIGFYFKNDTSKQTVGDATRTVDEIEEITGFDFFSMLDDDLENKVEKMNNLGKWH